MLDTNVRSLQVSDYGALIRRQWWLITLLTAVGVLAAVWYTSTQPKVYTSTTQVLVTPTGAEDEAVSANGRTRTEINLDTEAQLLQSTAVVALAADLLGGNASMDDLVDQLRISVPPNTEVLAIAFDADTAAGAQDGAAAFAMAYLANRAQAAADQIEAREGSRRAQVSALTESLQEVTAALGALPPESSDRAVALAQIESLSAQIAILTAAANALDSTTITPGRTITEATLPAGPSSPVPFVNVAGGAMLGLLLGCGLALLRHRSSQRLDDAGEVARLTGLPVLVSIPRCSGVWLADATSAAGRGYVRLRNVLTARAAPDARIILVAGVDADGSEVADNLAATLARTGAEVVLVSTYGGSATAHRLGLATRWAGLSEVLGGQAGAAAALQMPAGLETLRVLTPGLDPERTVDLMETEAAGDLLVSLRRSARYVILEAPPTASSGLAQTLAALADAVLVVIQARTTRAEDVNDAIAQFTAMRTPLIGSVLVPPGRQRRGRMLLAGHSPSQPGSGKALSNDTVPIPAATDVSKGRTERLRTEGTGPPAQATKAPRHSSGRQVEVSPSKRRASTPPVGNGGGGKGAVSRSPR